MRKQWILKLTSVSLVAVMAAAMGGQALAIDWHPSRTQSEVEVSESTTTTTTGSTITVTTPTGDQVQDSEAAVIQVTPVSVTLAANAAVEAANPGATAEQLAAAATESGLSYAANGQLNNLYNQVTNAESTEGQRVRSHCPVRRGRLGQRVGCHRGKRQCTGGHFGAWCG